MADVAQLGFVVNTDELKAANDQLDKLPTSAGEAERSVKNLNETTEEGSGHVNRFREAVEGVGESIKENIVDAFKQAVAGMVAFFAIEQLTDRLKETAESMDELSKSARAVGSSFASFQAVQVAGELAGQSADAIDAASKRMSKAIGVAAASGKGTSGVFKELGISAQQLAKMPIDVRFATIADKIKTMGLNTSATTALLAKLGDRSGSLTTLFQDGGEAIRNASEDVTKFHLALSTETGVAVEDMMDNFTRLGFAIQGMFNQIVGAVAPVLGPMVGMMATGIANLVGGIGSLLPLLGQAAIIAALVWGPGAIAAVGAMVIGIGTDMVAAMLSFNAVTEANPIALIVTAIGLVILAVYNFRDQIKQIFGVDVGAIMMGAANYFIKIFEVAFAQIGLIWNAFPSVIASATRGAVNYVINSINTMIAVSIAGINVLIDQIKKIPFIGDKVSGINPTVGQISTVGNAQGATDWAGLTGATKALNDYNSTVTKILQSDPMKGIVDSFKDFTTLGKPIESTASGIGTDLSGMGNAASGAAKKLQELQKAYNDVILSATNKIAQDKISIASLGQSAEQTEYLAEKQDLLNQTMKAGIALTPAVLNQLDGLARQEAQTAASAKALSDIYTQGQSVFTGFFSSIAQDIEQGKDVWTSLADAATQALDSILNKAIEVMANAAFNSLWSGGGSSSGGGIGGWISGLLGMGSGTVTSPMQWAGLAVNAKGGVYASGLSDYSNKVVSSPTMFKFATGAGIMGEAGPEAIMPLKRASNGSLGVVAASASNDNAANSNVVMVQPVIYNNASNDVAVTTGQDQNGNLVVQVDKIVAERINSPGSKTHKALKGTFGLNQAVKTR